MKCPFCEIGNLIPHLRSGEFGDVMVHGLEGYVCDGCSSQPIFPDQIRRNQERLKDARSQQSIKEVNQNMNKITPITPGEAVNKQGSSIPEFVIKVFNELIIEGMRESSFANVHQDSVIERITKNRDITRAEIFDKHWLDVEPLYTAQGWKVNWEGGVFMFRV